MLTWMLGGAAVVAAGLSGVVAVRRTGWDPGLHRMILVALLLPWVAVQGSLVRLSRSASLNPLGRRAADAAVLPGDWVAPLVLAALLVACLAWPRRLRAASVLLPLAGLALVWWVTLPLYASTAMRGWFFLTVGLAGPGPFVYHLAASAFLGGWVLPTLPGRAGARGGVGAGPPGGRRGEPPAPEGDPGPRHGRGDGASRAGV